MARTEHVERKRSAELFAQKWAGRGYEKGDTSSFWLELLEKVVGMKDVTTNVRFESATKDRGFIDVTIRDAKTVVEQKSLGVPLDKPELRQGTMVTPFEQAKRYADSLRNSERPDTIIVCDFDYFRIHDLDSEHPAEEYVTFRLSELPDQFHLLDFLIDPQQARRKREEKVSLDAGALIGQLYDKVRQQYVDPDAPESQHSLNVLCVRLVFLLFAEDSGVFQKDTFYRYLKSVPADFAHTALRELFEYLDTPEDQRDPYAPDALRAFPYVNGGLFADRQVEIPRLNQEILDFLLNEVSEDTDWSQISPTIFGGLFESTLNPETRRAGGMHYTSPQNIHRLIDPLFLDGLKAELEEVLTAEGVGDRKRRNQLEAFHKKIAGLTFFDPACGSGNFLTETYIHLRKLENKILSELQQGEGVMALEGYSPLKVSLSQFHGIEINDFAVNVATTAMWIAELQANAEAQSIVYGLVEDLPLQDTAHIVYGNALELDWAEVVNPEECDYIIGNPPFLGYSNLSDVQKEDRLRIMGKSGGVLDYVACWFKLAADYMKGSKTEAAFVSTNSITQGQQVAPLWKPLMDDGLVINFAHRTFTWANETKNAAHVHVVIIGFGYSAWETKSLFTHRQADLVDVDHPKNINAYLAPALSVFVKSTVRPVSAPIPMQRGNQPTDGGHLLLSEDDYLDLVKIEPEAQNWIKPFSMGEDFIKGKKRFCLWLSNATPSDFKNMPNVRSRIDMVRQTRLQSTKAATRKKADIPWLFDEIRYKGDGTYIAVPTVSSHRRRYVPMDFVTNGMIPGNKIYFVPTDSRYVLGILISRVHNAWLRHVGGRLKSDYNYTNKIVYNTLIWPATTEQQQLDIASRAEAVIDARAKYPEATLEDLYKPEDEWMYPELMAAHAALDEAVERAYGLEPGLDEADIVAHLFELYSKAIKDQ